jgi:hypothetical protein
LSTTIDTLDFGFILFQGGEVTIRPAGGEIKIGDNMNQPGSGNLRLAGFQGYPRPSATGYVCNRANVCCPEGENCYPDVDGQWATLVSQNGPFWKNISRIEATFFLESDADPNALGNVELFFQGGALTNWDWGQFLVNLLDEFSEDNGGDGFEWGTVMTAIWDVDKYAAEVVAEQPDVDFFGEVIDLNADNPDADPNYVGPAVNKLGITLQNEDIDDAMVVTINWTNVRIFVHDMDLFESQLAEIAEATDGFAIIDPAMRDRVFLATPCTK